MACIAYAGLSEICRIYLSGHVAYAYWIPRDAIVLVPGAAGPRSRVNFGKHLRSMTLADLAHSRAPNAEDDAKARARANAPDAICAICLDSFADIDAEAAPEPALSEIRRCGHVFCERCIAHWLAAHHTCPLCAQDVTDVSDEIVAPSCCGWFMMHQC